jgi:hypothetical protein
VPRVLTVFDVTNITVGAIVGADIYVASAITAGLLGRPRCLLARLAAGLHLRGRRAEARARDGRRVAA